MVEETSSCRRASLTIFLNRLVSSTEIIFAPGELGDFAARARSLDFTADAFCRLVHFGGCQAVFLQRIVARMNFNRAQRDNLATEHKTNIFARDGFLQPEAEPPATFRDCQSLHTLIIASQKQLTTLEWN